MTQEFLKAKLNFKSMKSQPTTTNTNTLKVILVLFTLLLSGISIAQTTVTLEDQCNCEVLQGTAVSTPGAVTPAGADLGDLYVNTTSGTIFFWDGDSWELTALDTDNQQLQNFSFNTTTNVLSLEIEDGNSVSVDVSTLVGSDNQTAAEVSYDNSSSALTATNVQQAIDEINAAAGTVALVDNGDGTYDFTNAAGLTTTISDTSVSTLSNNGDGTYTYTDEAGIVSTIDTNASSNPYNNTTSGLTAINVQQAIDEINAAAGTVALVDNGDGTYDFTNAAGLTTTISDTSVSTLSNNGDGTYTYTDEAGIVSTIDTNSFTITNTVVGNRIMTITDGAGNSDDINETITSIVDNNNGTITFTREDTNTQTISKSQITDNGDATFTFDNGNGAPVVFVGTDDQIASEIDFTPSGNTTSTEVQAAIEELQGDIDGLDGTDDQDLGIGQEA